MPPIITIGRGGIFYTQKGGKPITLSNSKVTVTNNTTLNNGLVSANNENFEDKIFRLLKNEGI